MKINKISKAGGCGCKMSPLQLEEFLDGLTENQDLLNNKEDCSIISIDEDNYLLKSMDFFTPIVEDPYVYGKAAAANALSDIYAKGGTPLMIQSIVGWPTDVLSIETLREVFKGANEICKESNISISGGHTIISKEPIFGLSVTGIVKKINFKPNNNLNKGDLIFITKPIGTGILSTCQKLDKLDLESTKVLYETISKSNIIGIEVSKLQYVKSVTDITGFGLLCHLLEMTSRNNVKIKLMKGNIPFIPESQKYLNLGIETSGGKRNRKYFERYQKSTDFSGLYFDPQSNGGLAIVIDKKHKIEFVNFLIRNNLSQYVNPIASVINENNKLPKFSFY